MTVKQFLSKMSNTNAKIEVRNTNGKLLIFFVWTGSESIENFKDEILSAKINRWIPELISKNNYYTPDDLTLSIIIDEET